MFLGHILNLHRRGKMKKITVEMFTGQGNYAVLRLPERNYPGVIFQGDTVATICSNLENIRQQARKIKNQELVEDVEYLVNQFNEILNGYERVLEENNIKLPYVKSENKNNID